MNTRVYTRVYPRGQTLRVLFALLFAAGVISCLFSLLLPASASLLPPTVTPTSTATNTPSPTHTPTSTITPLPSHLITPGVTQFGGYTVYWRRQLWEQAAGAAGAGFTVENFEPVGNSLGSIELPHITGKGFSLSGQSYAELIRSVQLLPNGTLLHFRDWEQGLTIAFPDDTPVTAFAFDYTTPEQWLLTYNDVELALPSGSYLFVGFLLQQGSTRQFNLASSAYAQGGLSMDNLSYLP